MEDTKLPGLTCDCPKLEDVTMDRGVWCSLLDLLLLVTRSLSFNPNSLRLLNAVHGVNLHILAIN